MLNFFKSGSEIGHIVKAHGKALTQVGVMSAVLNILTLGGSFFMLLVYDDVLPSRSFPTLIGLLIMITMVYVFQALLDLIRGRAMIQMGAILDQRVSRRVFDVITRYELQRGPLREGMQPVRDLDTVRSVLSSAGPIAIMDLPWVLLFLLVLTLFHWVLGLLALVGVIILVALMISTARLTEEPTKTASSVASARFALADSSRRNAEVLMALGMTGRARASWEDISNRSLAVNDELAEISGRMQSISKTFRMLFQSLMLAAGAALVIEGMASGGIIIASSILSSRALAPVEQAIAHWKGLINGMQAWTRLDAVLDLIPEEGTVMALPAPERIMTVENVSVGPPGAQRLTVGDVSFQLEAGEALGIIGPSGSGKSSLVRALIGVWRPARGTVRLDGAAIDQWTSDDLGQHMGYMPQKIELFDGTVAQNIARFLPEADAESIIAAANAADVHDMIVRLPGGYEYPLGPNGGNLSAGQQQRVALARALYGNPFLVVLDEPNSNLDANGEAALARAIASVRERKGIVIIVAHRPSALAQVSHVLLMQNGGARAFGPRDEVLDKLNLVPAPLQAVPTTAAAGKA